MSLNIKLLKSMFYISFVSILISSCSHTVVSIDDTSGDLGKTNAPVSIQLDLNTDQVLAAKEGRLMLINPSTQSPIPVQLENHNIIYIKQKLKISVLILEKKQKIKKKHMY